jgi:hypothetical protein
MVKPIKTDNWYYALLQAIICFWDRFFEKTKFCAKMPEIQNSKELNGRKKALIWRQKGVALKEILGM